MTRKMPNPSLEPTCYGIQPLAVCLRTRLSSTLGAMTQSTRPDIAAMWFAVATALLLVLAGCAAERGSKPSSSPFEPASYVGVFTGEFVDGRPLYRFPPILVVGSRRSVAPDM